jgi:drug/metabolite transporter (DMT)-like permease
LIGELSALGAALLWAITGVILKHLSYGFNPLHLNHIRCISAVILFSLFLISTGELKSIPYFPIRSLILSTSGTIIAVAIGESLFVLSLRHLELARAYPISICGWPVVTLSISLIFLDEIMKWMEILGVFLILFGLYLLTFHEGSSPWMVSLKSLRKEKMGLLLIGLTVLSWGAGTVLIKMGAEGQVLPVTNFIRFAITSVVLIPFTYSHWVEIRTMDRLGKRLFLACLSGIIGFGLGGILFLIALTKSGAGMTAVLSSTSPLFLLPMSVIFFHEKVTFKMFLGVISSIIGVGLLFLYKI